MTDTQIALIAWTVAGFALIALETALPGMIVFMFGLGSLCTALCVWIFGVQLEAQLGIFAVTSALALIFLRKIFQRAMRGNAADAKSISSISSMLGVRGVVSDEIPKHGTGKIQARGSYWAAWSDEHLPKGTSIEVIEERRPDEPRVKVRRA